VLVFAPRAGAATGDTLRTITAANPSNCTLNTGIAFDGTNLIESCWANNDLDVINPADGSLVKTVSVTGTSGMGALAWDGTRGQLWACNLANDHAVLVDMSTGVATDQFATQGCVDGLAYDGTDDTIWASDDAASSTQHFSITGTLLNSFTIGSLLGGAGNSGIAVGGNQIFLANDGSSQVYQLPKDFSTSTLFFSYSTRLEDLECDSKDFAPLGAMWVQDAYDRDLHAVEMPPGLCISGGGDKAAPVASATAPACSSTGALTVTLADDAGGSGPKAVHYRVDGGAEQVVDASSGSATITVSNGTHSIEYWGEDVAGNQEATHHTLSLKVDTVNKCAPAAAPKVGVAGVRRACASKSFNVAFRVTTASSVKRVTVKLDGKKVSSTTKARFKLKINTKKLKAGRHRLSITAVDGAGNTSTVRRTFSVCKAVAPKKRVAPRFTG
jgi:hypothetical protein